MLLHGASHLRHRDTLPFYTTSRTGSYFDSTFNRRLDTIGISVAVERVM